ncbi:hypothetical protein C8A01DRAFT_44448 [Parachaetomium inaequale]|uniref:Peptidase A1 domain-containing protein n=1 Tax=Parachaetomium inaequale TaxID=2588326 RepID=A0AAN6SU18_9PEZI|nr:hypothetical protein C8A01DRAFT_44448 [Parachaetomium inaequale]
MSSSLPILALSLAGLALAAEPRQAAWSSKAFGPDGPWNAVEVSIGSQPKIALFPGRMFHTYVTTSDYCALNTSVSHCASGTYLKDKITTSSARGISWKPPTQLLSAGIETRGTANMYLETIDIPVQAGAEPGIVTVRNHSIALIESESQMYAYPDGTLYPIFTGCLSVGSPDPQQVFTGGGGSGTDVNASMIPWALESAGTTASSSFGLHYGSAGASAKMSGSLLFGGYDRNRVVGSILSLDADLRNPATLQDISLHVIKGASPFPPSTTSTASPSTITGLLAQGDSTTTTTNGGAAGTLPVILDPCSPYLTLPKSTCDAIAAHLPVTYNASLGLYLWNTTSPRYRLLTTAATTLAFTLMGTSNTQSLTIHVPLPHLTGLTLAPPFTALPAPYFPCFTGGVKSQGWPSYALGRAFFQDAFLGANWERGVAWLAQAPGPNIPAGLDVVSVAAGDEAIAAGGNDWERSWDGVWKGLTEGDVEGLVEEVEGGGEGGGGDGTARTGAGGLSTGAIVGIGVGAAVVGAVLVGAAGLILWRRRKAGPQVTGMAPPPVPKRMAADALTTQEYLRKKF